MEICPEADLGPPDAHPNCEKFTEHHWPDLARWRFHFLMNLLQRETWTTSCFLLFKSILFLDLDAHEQIDNFINERCFLSSTPYLRCTLTLQFCLWIITYLITKVRLPNLPELNIHLHRRRWILLFFRQSFRFNKFASFSRGYFLAFKKGGVPIIRMEI